MTEASTVKRVLDQATGYLAQKGSESARLDAQLLLGHVCDLDKVQLYVQYDRPLLAGELAAFRDLVKRRARGEPVAYILGKKEFYGRPFSVDARVLVPRPETEHLVDVALKYVRDGGIEAPRIVDVGTGSGALAVTLAAELPGAVVAAIDVSPDALTLAALNAERHGVRDRVRFVRGDALDPIATEGSADVVVSNPPYLDDALMATLPPDVRDHEPRLALYGGPDGLDVLRRIHTGAIRVLKPGGLLAVEVAGDAQAEALAALWRDGGAFEPAETVRDYQKLARIVWALRQGA